MATSYPGGLDAFTNPVASDATNSGTVPHAGQHTNANDAIEAIEAELGTDPAGTYATVKDRLNLGDWNLDAFLKANGGGTTIAQIGIGATATGTATASSAPADTNAHTRLARLDYLVTVAATTAIAGWRSGVARWQMSANAYTGGFRMVQRFGPATGVATSTTRLFVGMTSSTGAPTDVQPSSLTNIIGVGYDAADTNLQLMHNDGSGTATKVNLGSSFPVPTADRTNAYEVTLTNEPGASTVQYRVVNLTDGSVASGSLSTDLPATSTLLCPRGWMSVGGTSSVVGFALEHCRMYAKGL